MAKVFLSAGFYVYGEPFRKLVRHEKLRPVLKGPSNMSASELEDCGVHFFDYFRPIKDEY